MTETYRASIGAILSVITGRVVCNTDEMFALHDHLAGRPLMTHEYVFPGMAAAHSKTLLAQFPGLADIEFPPIDSDDREAVRAHCEAWVAEVSNRVGWTEADVIRDPETGTVDPGAAMGHVLDLMTRGRDRRDREALGLPEDAPLPWEGHDDPEDTTFIAVVESSDDVPPGRFGPFPTRRKAWLALGTYVRNGNSEVWPMRPAEEMVRR